MNHDAYYGTLDEQYWELMLAPSRKFQKGATKYCCVCGRFGHIEEHHIVWRSWGELHDMHGRKLEKPTIPLCGYGNTSGWCHGDAHDGKLLFRYVETQAARDFKWAKTKTSSYGAITGGHLEFLKLPVGYKEFLGDKNATYKDALKLEGWRRCL